MRFTWLCPVEFEGGEVVAKREREKREKGDKRQKRETQILSKFLLMTPKKYCTYLVLDLT